MRELTKIRIDAPSGQVEELSLIGFCGLGIVPVSEGGKVGIQQVVVGDMNAIDLIALRNNLTEELLPTLDDIILQHMLKANLAAKEEQELKNAETIHKMAQLAEEGES